MTMTDQTRATSPDTPATEPQRFQRDYRQSAATDESEVNVGMTERHISIAVGTTLALLGLQRRSIFGLILAGVGGGLIYRGVTGHCPGYEAAGLDTSSEE